jgi:hypothetical protein
MGIKIPKNTSDCYDERIDERGNERTTYVRMQRKSKDYQADMHDGAWH